MRAKLRELEEAITDHHGFLLARMLTTIDPLAADIAKEARTEAGSGATDTANLYLAAGRGEAAVAGKAPSPRAAPLGVNPDGRDRCMGRARTGTALGVIDPPIRRSHHGNR